MLSTANEKEKPNFDTDFKQQRLRAWQPILTPRQVIGFFMIISIFFIPIGVSIYLASEKVFEKAIQYNNIEECSLKIIGNATYPQYGRVCNVTYTFTQDVKLPVYVYYQLDNFYQNHRRYVKSRSDDQLIGEATTSGCDPMVKGTNGKKLYPCGLIAHSYFSDKIIAYIQPFVNGSSFSNVIPLVPSNSFDYNQTDIESQKKDGIAQASDRNSKFKLLPGIESEADTLSGSEFSNKQTRVGEEQNRINTALFGKNYDHYAPQTVKILLPTDEDMIVQMRTASLPSFKKFYRQIMKLPKGVGSNRDKMFLKGDVITFSIKNYFRVDDFNGKKYIVMSTTSWIGGKNNFLGITYIVVGSICFLLAIVFLLKHIISPRELGDMRYINQGNANSTSLNQAEQPKPKNGNNE